jgi:hypothetical protein
MDPNARLTVPDAAARLGITVEALRMRIKRGTVAHEKIDGTVYILLDTERTQPNNQPNDVQHPSTDALISEMRRRIYSLERQLEHEREANRENRRLLAAALERIPSQLEPPQEEATPEPRESPVTASEPQDRMPPETHDDPETGRQRRSWWRRLFDG